ncbi:MAG: 3-deoxy-7-phosphoheptulonate synthase [Pseudomonadota bacterium]
MLLILDREISREQKDSIKTMLAGQKCITREINDAGMDVIGVIGKLDRTAEELCQMGGIAKVVPIPTAHKLVSRAFKSQDTKVAIGDVIVGGDRIVIIAGPCAVESRDQALTIAREVKKYGAALFRGGAYKPRSSPYSFQGLEEKGLEILAEVREKTGLRVVTEITSPAQAELMKHYVDAVQIGARNMQNFELLKCVGRLGLPVVLKRGLASTIQEWLMSAEYIVSEGNDNVILCERGIRTFEPYTRNTLDLSAIPVLKQLTHLPVLIDPSHATGIREKVSPMARAAVAAGADALMIEVHNDPDHAMSDGPQSLYPRQFAKLTRDIYVIAPVVGKQMDFNYLEKSARMNLAVSAGAGTISFLGALGSFSHKACNQYFGESITPQPQDSFKAVFEAVKTGQAEFGVVPLENSLSGSIHENYDLLQEYDLTITGEITLRIVHSLIGLPGADLAGIRTLLAPPPALQQCRNFLDQNQDITPMPVSATASAVKTVSESKDPSLAAIGSCMAAGIYGMKVLEEAIEDNPRNFTRFVIIATAPDPGCSPKKSSIIFATGNRPGALFEVMKIFSENAINMVKLESRPIHGKPWEYMFYADLETDVLAGDVPLMDLIGQKTEYCRVLGTY